MKISDIFNWKNISLFSGVIGFSIIFILFAFHIYTVELLSPEAPSEVMESFGYSSYVLFFAKNDKAFHSGVSPIFFSFFIINFVFYLSLLIIRMTKNCNEKLQLLGVIGIVINSVCIILFFVFIFAIYGALLDFQYDVYEYIQFDFSTLIVVFLLLEYIGLFANYVSWIYTCKDCAVEHMYQQITVNNKAYYVLSLLTLILFFAPIFLFGLLLLLILGASKKNTKGQIYCCYGNVQGQPYYRNTQGHTCCVDESKNTVTIDNKKYLLFNNIITDPNTRKEIGHIDNDGNIIIEPYN